MKKVTISHVLEQQLSPHLSWVLFAALNETNMFVRDFHRLWQKSDAPTVAGA